MINMFSKGCRCLTSLVATLAGILIYLVLIQIMFNNFSTGHTELLRHRPAISQSAREAFGDIIDLTCEVFAERGLCHQLRLMV